MSPCSIVFVDDQEKALKFYTEVLGFVKVADIPLGDARWLTFGSPDGSGGVQLLLEPNGNPVAKTYQEAIFGMGIPATSFTADDIRAEHARMTKLGVVFTMAPTATGPVIQAVFDDTCGNLIGLNQVIG